MPVLRKESCTSLSSPYQRCVGVYGFVLFFFPPATHPSINFQLRAAMAVSELIVQVTAKLGKKKVSTALASCGRKHFHLTLK